MDPKFFRKYSDIIFEAEQPQQLDEGMLQDLKTKASTIMAELKKIKGIGAAFQQAKAFAPELKQVFMSAKSGKEVMDGIKRVVAAKSGNQALAERTNELVGGAIGTIGGLSITVYEMATGFFDVLVRILLTGGGESQAAALWFLGVPIMCAVAGAFLLWYHHQEPQ